MVAQFLLHTDVFKKVLSSGEKTFSDILAKARKGEIKLWILPSTLIEAHRKMTLAEQNKLKEWLDVLKVVSITSQESKDSITAKNPELYLAEKAVTGFHLNAALTLDPLPQEEWPMPFVSPSNLNDFLRNLKVKSVPLVSPPASYHQIWDDLETSLAEVIRPGRFILGAKVKELETKIAAYCQTNHAVGVSSGTDALLIALMAGDIGPGDEVITTPYTFFATVGSISRVGATPVFADIEPDSFNISPNNIESKITGKTKAIIPVHLYGQCADMDSILDIAQNKGLAVIEDAAQAIGAEYKFKRAGSFGNFGCFSFFPTKNLGGFGDGGIVTTSSDEAAEKLRLLRVHGSKIKYRHQIIGGNFRLDALQAAAVSAKLKYLETWSETRRQIALNYCELFEKSGLSEKVSVPKEIFPRHIYNQFVIRVVGERDVLKEFLQTRGVSTEIYYPLPLHMQECFASLGYKRGDFPESEKASAETLALPVSHEITQDQQTFIVSAVADFFS